MIGLSVSHLLFLLIIVLIVFGAGKLPQVMRDVALGLRAFRDGLQDPPPPSRLHEKPPVTPEHPE